MLLLRAVIVEIVVVYICDIACITIKGSWIPCSSSVIFIVVAGIIIVVVVVVVVVLWRVIITY